MTFSPFAVLYNHSHSFIRVSILRLQRLFQVHFLQCSWDSRPKSSSLPCPCNCYSVPGTGDRIQSLTYTGQALYLWVTPAAATGSVVAPGNPSRALSPHGHKDTMEVSVVKSFLLIFFISNCVLTPLGQNLSTADRAEKWGRCLKLQCHIWIIFCLYPRFSLLPTMPMLRVFSLGMWTSLETSRGKL